MKAESETPDHCLSVKVTVMGSELEQTMRVLGVASSEMKGRTRGIRIRESSV